MRAVTEHGEGYVEKVQRIHGSRHYFIEGGGFKGWFKESEVQILDEDTNFEVDNDLSHLPWVEEDEDVDVKHKLVWAGIQLLGSRQSAWADVRQKARRLRKEMNIEITRNDIDYVEAQVTGDNGTYFTYVQRHGSFDGDFKVTGWGCTCKWGEWAWKREETYVGRMCSHALALYYEMQSLWYRKDASVSKLASIAHAYRMWCKEKNFDSQNPDSLSIFVEEKGLGESDRELLEDILFKTSKMSRVAGKIYTPEEEMMLIDERGVASQLDELKLDGTHYI